MENSEVQNEAMPNADFDSTNPEPEREQSPEEYTAENEAKYPHPPEHPAVFITDGPALDEAFRQEDAKSAQDPSHRFHWHGVDILGNTHLGSGNTSAECYAQQAALGAVTCHLENNPGFIEPDISEPEAKPISAFKANDFYAQGYADGDAAYQDIKTLILTWVTDQMLSSNPGFAQEVESLPFVVYARFNR